jgi:hypothetical protein
MLSGSDCDELSRAGFTVQGYKHPKSLNHSAFRNPKSKIDDGIGAEIILGRTVDLNKKDRATRGASAGAARAIP